MILSKFDLHVCLLFFVSEYHNTNGPLKITETAFTRVSDIFLNGGKELGYKIHDCNGNDGDQEGKCDLKKKKISLKDRCVCKYINVGLFACSKFYAQFCLSLPFLSVLRVLQASDVYWRRVTVKYSSKFFTSGL